MFTINHKISLFIVGFISAVLSVVSMVLVFPFVLTGLIFSFLVSLYLKKIKLSKIFQFFIALVASWAVVFLSAIFLFSRNFSEQEGFLGRIFFLLIMVLGALFFYACCLIVLPNFQHKTRLFFFVSIYAFLWGVIHSLLYFLEDESIIKIPEFFDLIEAYSSLPIIIWQVGMATILGWALDKQQKIEKPY